MTNNGNLKTEYNAIDIFKFICSILVCTIHIVPFSAHILKNAHGINFYIGNCLARIAVPFFFTTAGFFIYKKAKIDNPDTSTIKNYCFKILRLLGTWSALLFLGKKIHLWYLSALVISILLITLLLKKKIKIQYIIIITIFLYIIGLIGDSYYEVTRIFKNIPILNNIIVNYETYFKTTRNGIFFGPIFVAIGALIASNKVKINLKLSYLGVIISFYLLVVEVFILFRYFDPKDYNMFISLVPLTFFSLNTLINIRLKDRKIYKRLRIMSILIYFMHFFLIDFSQIILNSLKTNCHINLYDYQFLIVIILTILFSFIIEILSETKKLELFKYLYS